MCLYGGSVDDLDPDEFEIDSTTSFGRSAPNGEHVCCLGRIDVDVNFVEVATSKCLVSVMKFY
ncbi:hypothetical protein VCSRO82_2978 [Vibrio cholerae]|nr:hypothetical protein VCSRO82_2978 [Vibrio cholerae]